MPDRTSRWTPTATIGSFLSQSPSPHGGPSPPDSVPRSFPAPFEPDDAQIGLKNRPLRPLTDQNPGLVNTLPPPSSRDLPDVHPHRGRRAPARLLEHSSWEGKDP